MENEIEGSHNRFWWSKIRKMIYRRSRKFLLIFCLVIMLLLICKMWYFKMDKIKILINKLSVSAMSGRLQTIDSKKDGNTVPFAPSFSHMYSCPICFGYGMCNDVMRGSILFHGELQLASNAKVLWKKGVLQTRRVFISSLILEEWNKLDEFLCKNASQAVPCDLSTAVWKTVFGQEDLLSVQKFRTLNILLDLPITQLALPVCSSPKLLSEVIKSFDENYDGVFNKEERILLLTSLVMHPGYVVLKLQAKTRMTMPIPTLLGACGRSIIIEGGLKPLKSFLSESFDTRAGLAVQVLQLVEDFEEEDPQWYFLYLGFSLDGIVVTNEGEVVIIDLDNIVILDKSLFPPDTKKQVLNNGLCNEVCFQKITLKMFYSADNSSACSYISEYGQLMYAIVCKQVLSDIVEHRTEGFFNFDGHRVHRKQENSGLLHSVPLKYSEQIEDLLRECVQETKPGGRKKAVANLRDTLENYVNINDSEGQNSHERNLFWNKKMRNIH